MSSYGRTLYIAHDGATIQRQGERLTVRAKRRHLSEVPVRNLGQLVLMGNLMLTPAALDLLVARGVDTVLLSHTGRYRARIVSGVSTNIRLRLAQYRLLSSDGGPRTLAEAVVRGKIHNQRALLMRHARRHGKSTRLDTARVALEASLRRLDRAGSVDEIRGCEGAASAAYFRAFGALLRSDELRFDGRNRRPPLDPVNALLSLGYTLLMNAVEAAVHLVGLDAYLGALHAPTSGRPSLALDLAEEFRAPVVDALVVSSINQGAIEASDFEDAEPGDPVVIKREAVKWFVTLFERRMNRKSLYPPTGNHHTWRDIIEQQGRALARHVLGESSYEALVIR